MHGKSPQNDKQKAQTKLSFHDVSATNTKRDLVSLENKEHLKRLYYWFSGSRTFESCNYNVNRLNSTAFFVTKLSL